MAKKCYVSEVIDVHKSGPFLFEKVWGLLPNEASRTFLKQRPLIAGRQKGASSGRKRTDSPTTLFTPDEAPFLGTEGQGRRENFDLPNLSAQQPPVAVRCQKWHLRVRLRGWSKWSDEIGTSSNFTNLAIQ